MALDPQLIALASTIFAGAGMKVAEHYLNRGRSRIDDASKIRDELRMELSAHRDEIRLLEADVDKWRAEYYNLREQHMKIQTELTIALGQLKDALDKLSDGRVD